MALGDRHHRRVDEPEIEISVQLVNLSRSPEQAGGKKRDRVLTVDQRGKKKSRRLVTNARPDEVVDLDSDGIGHDEFTPESPDDRSSELVHSVAAIDRCDDR